MSHAERRAPLVTRILVILLTFAAAPVRAMIEGSPHDLVSQDYAAPRTGTPQDRCTLCHVEASDPADSGLFPKAPPSLRNTYNATTLACFSCHDGITLVALEVDASLTAFHPASHRGAAAVLVKQAEGTPGEEQARSAECITCHDPHENSHRPFLKKPLEELCTSCHGIFNEMALGAGNLTGSHPVGIDPAATLRPEVPIQILPPFAIAFPIAYPLQDARGTSGTHWDLGGHLAGGSTGVIVCATCHTVHGGEESPPTAGLLAVDPVNEVANLLCEGCHRGQRGDGVPSTAAPNPGGTTIGRTYHPCDDDVANGPGRITSIRVPAGLPFGSGEPPRLVCSSCHVSHRAKPGSSLLRPVASGTGLCGECHDRGPSPFHHPTGKSSGACAQRLPRVAEDAVPEITCDLCHRAHNAGFGTGSEADHVPLLRAGLGGDDLCVTCHARENQSCSADPARRSSHFLGDPTLPETFNNLTPPLRLDPWPESGLASRYGGASGKAVICLSCHSFREGALISGDDGATGFLLAQAGNAFEWESGSEGNYLCAGCHGVTPGTATEDKGHTHPLMEASILNLQAPVAPPLSSTPGGRVNCDSCHRSHGASTASGVYMLEVADGPNLDPVAIKPQINFTPLCHGCHPAEKY